jgi:hypothetical protein
MAEIKTENKEKQVINVVPLDVALGQLEICKQILLNNAIALEQKDGE